jgi:hypothetical protein
MQGILTFNATIPTKAAPPLAAGLKHRHFDA